MSEHRFFNFFDENLKIITTCPVCATRYNPIEARVLADKGDGHLLYIKCSQCHAAVLAVVMASQVGVSSIGLVTDLSSEDIVKFLPAQPISSDDVISLYQSLVKHKVVSDQRLHSTSNS
jgi:hypothetical protein